jgi:hypothetical protein
MHTAIIDTQIREAAEKRVTDMLLLYANNTKMRNAQPALKLPIN